MLDHQRPPATPASARITVAIAVLAGLFAIVIRWYFVTRVQVLQPVYEAKGWGDAAEYYRYAWHMIHHGVFSSDPIAAENPRPDSFRDPAYPAFLALWMMVTDSYERWYGLVLLSHAVLGGVTVTCATLAARDALPRWLLALAALTMALWPHLVSIPAYVLSENLTAPLWALAALALGEAARRRSMTYTVVGGASLAIAALTNAVLGPLAVLLGLAFAWKRTMPRRQIGVFVVIMAAPLLAWGIRNATMPSNTWLSSFRAEINLVQGSWPTYHVASQLYARHDPIGTQTIDAIDNEVLTLHRDHIEGLKLMLHRMSGAPGTYIAWYLSKPALLWGWQIGLGAGDIYVYPTRNSPFMTNPLMRAVEAVTYIFNGVLALLALAGVIVVVTRRAPSAAMLVFAGTAVWVTFVYGVLQSDARYSIPYRTGEIVLACLALTAGTNFMRQRRDLRNAVSETPAPRVVSDKA